MEAESKRTRHLAWFMACAKACDWSQYQAKHLANERAKDRAWNHTQRIVETDK